MSDIKKLVNDLVYKGTKELWFDPKNYETKEASNNYFYSPFFSGYVGDLDIPFKVRLPLSTAEKELKINAIFGSETGYISIQPGRDINYDIKIDTQNEEIEYILTYHYAQSLTKKSDVALILKTYNVFDFVNLLKYINIKPASESFINDEFRKAFSRVESDDDKLNWLYENAYPSAIKDRKDEQLWNDLLRLSKHDGKKWFVDTGSAVMNIAQSFSDIKWIINKLKTNQETLMEVYNTISDYETKSAFSTMINAFIILEGNNLHKPVFLKGSLYTFDKFTPIRENKLFRIVNQKKGSTKVIASNMGAVTSQDFTTVEHADLNPCDLVIIEDTDIKTSFKKPVKTAPSAAIMLYYMADNADHEAWVKMLRLTLDVAAILTAAYSGGTTPVLIRFAEAGLALTDIAMMDDGVRKFLSENGGEWFVENWDTIYLMAGLGFLSRVIINGILAKGPALLESLKNARNIPRNWLLFRKDLEKLIKELEAYEARQAAVITNEIEEVVIKGDKYALWRKVLNLASSSEKYIEKVVQDLSTKGLSIRKTEEGLYELLYNGRIIKTGKDFEIGRFVKKSFYLGTKDKDLLPAFTEISTEIVSKVGKRELRQKYNDLDKLYEAAKKANNELVEITKKVAKETNGRPGVRPKEINNGLKGRERALEKIMVEYDKNPNLLIDIAGSKIIYEKLGTLYNALEKVSKEYKILRIKDRIQDPLNGYRDILMNLEMKNGHIVEFRLHVKEMDKVADGVGHKLYEQQRSLEAISKVRNLTREEKIKITQLKKEQFKLYENAWKKIINK